MPDTPQTATSLDSGLSHSGPSHSTKAGTPLTSEPFARISPSSDDWYADPRATFDAWLTLQRFRPSSILVYRAQWHHFLDWLAARGRDLRSTEPALIDEFAATIDVKRQQRARYLRIMERVFDEMGGQSQALGNPARAVTRSVDAPWTDTASNAPTGFLGAAERARLWEELASGFGTDGQPLPWRDLRDRAMAAMLLGAGLKLNELESMQMDQVRLSVGTPRNGADQSSDVIAVPRWSIQQETDQRGGVLWIARADAGDRPRNAFPVDTQASPDLDELGEAALPSDAPRNVSGVTASTAGSPALAERQGYRSVPFPLHAAAVLQRWLQARAENAVEGELVFPAGRSGLQMHKATALRAIDTLVERSGLRALRHGRISPQTLRNAYAAALFAAGLEDDTVAERLGMVKVLSARRLRAAWDLARADPGALAASEGSETARPSRRRDRA